MKPIYVLLLFLAITTANVLDAQAPIPKTNKPIQDSPSAPRSKLKPLQKRANEELFHQRRFINDCNDVRKTDCHMPANYTSNIVQIGGGTSYTGTTKGIILWDNYTNISITTDNAHIPENNITALALDDDGQLWIGTYSSGVVIGTGHDIKPFRIEHVQTHNIYVVSIYVEAGLVWVAYQNGGLECFINGISCRYYSPYPN